MAMAKTRSVDGSQLQVACLEDVPRPFASDNIGAITLRTYERYRGLKSRDYATKCLLVVGDCSHCLSSAVSCHTISMSVMCSMGSYVPYPRHHGFWSRFYINRYAENRALCNHVILYESCCTNVRNVLVTVGNANKPTDINLTMKNQ